MYRVPTSTDTVNALLLYKFWVCVFFLLSGFRVLRHFVKNDAVSFALCCFLHIAMFHFDFPSIHVFGLYEFDISVLLKWYVIDDWLVVCHKGAIHIYKHIFSTVIGQNIYIEVDVQIVKVVKLSFYSNFRKCIKQMFAHDTWHLRMFLQVRWKFLFFVSLHFTFDSWQK